MTSAAHDVPGRFRTIGREVGERGLGKRGR